MRDAKRGHLFGVDVALKGERLVKAPKFHEEVPEVALSVDYSFLTMREIAPHQSQIGLTHRKRFVGS